MTFTLLNECREVSGSFFTTKKYAPKQYFSFLLSIFLLSSFNKSRIPNSTEFRKRKDLTARYVHSCLGAVLFSTSFHVDF